MSAVEWRCRRTRIACAAAICAGLWTSADAIAVQEGSDACARAQAAQSRQDLDAALAAWNDCLAQPERPRSTLAEAYYGRGRIHLERDALADAIDDLDRAIELAPEFSDAYLWRGLAHRRSGLKSRFFADMKSALEHAGSDESRALALRHRGDGYARLELLGQALADLDRSIVLDPTKSRSFLLRAQVRRRMNMPRKALSDLDEALRLEPELVLGYQARSELNTVLGRHEQAVQDSTAAVRLDPHSASGHALRCAVLSALGIAELAVESCQLAVRLEPSVETHQLEHAFARWQLGEIEAAREALGLGAADSDTARALERELLGTFPRLLGEKLLAGLGYDVAPVDGVVDEATRAALAAFSAEHGVAADAAFDASTLEQLRAVLHRRIPYRPGTSDLVPPEPVLEVMTGPAKGRRMTLWEIPVTLGRGGGQVARIERDGDAYALVHVSGDPPPGVNGALMSASRLTLSDGDVLGLFGVEIAFRVPR